MTRVALVHDWLTGMRGGERCLEALIEMYPECEIFTLVHVSGTVSTAIEQRPIHVSFVDSLPARRKYYRYYLPLFPRAIERFDLRGFDLIISTSHCVAKGVRVPAGARHLCYCFTPMRYIWDLYEDYFGRDRADPLTRAVMPAIARYLRTWDTRSSDRVHRFVACSRHISRRIQRVYGRSAPVVYPPVAADRFDASADREGFYLAVSALVPYKRLDLAIAAFNRMGRQLVVVGEGSELRKLDAMAGPTITFAGRVSDEEVAELMTRCRALVHCAEEDFGIVAVEAQAAGAPVIGYGVGGLRETVLGAEDSVHNGTATGVFFLQKTLDGLTQAVGRFETMQFSRHALRSNAERFSPAAFQHGMREQIEQLMKG